ncbi:MAG: GNAT family N-acetyltransferase [Pseudomonadota bacterium]
MITIIKADTKDLILTAKSLFQEYAESLDFDLCFQNFNQELQNLAEQYASPLGCLFLAFEGETAIGCIGLRLFEKKICEMKRLYVKPEYRNLKVGKLLVENVIKAGKFLNYDAMRLDTLPSMKSANALYKSFGFELIAPYRHNPIEGAIYMELNLK